MTKLISLLVFTIGICFATHAQSPVVKENVEYCELTTDTKGFKARAKVFIDYGNGDEKLVDDKGREVLFDSPVGALNYMHTKGWEVTDIYRENGYTYYFLRRKH